MKRFYKIPVVSLVVLALVIPLIVFLAIASDSEKPGLEVGTVAPSISGVTLSGQSESLSQILSENQWVVVNFFASWCPPCIVEHREFIKLKSESPYPVEVISILFNESEQKGRDFFNLHGGDWPAFVNDTSRLAVNYAILSVPETYLITPAGFIASHWRGAVTAEGILDRIQDITDSFNR